MNSLLDNTRFHVLNVYSSQDLTLKRVLREQLIQICRTVRDEKMSIVGDFNSVRDDS